MKTEKRIANVLLTVSAPHYYDNERIEKAVHVSSVLNLKDLGLDTIETEVTNRNIETLKEPSDVDIFRMELILDLPTSDLKDEQKERLIDFIETYQPRR